MNGLENMMVLFKITFGISVMWCYELTVVVLVPFEAWEDQDKLVNILVPSPLNPSIMNINSLERGDEKDRVMLCDRLPLPQPQKATLGIQMVMIKVKCLPFTPT